MQYNTVYNQQESNTSLFKEIRINNGLNHSDIFRQWEYVHCWLCLSPLIHKTHILSIGSMRCLLTARLALLGHEVMGIDPDPQFPSWATIHAYNMRIMNCPVNINISNLEPNSYDYVISVSVFEHMENDDDKEASIIMGNVLRPGGRAILTVEMAKSYVEYKQYRGYYQGRFYDIENIMKRIVEPSGLELVDEPHWDPPIWKALKFQNTPFFGMGGPIFYPAAIVLQKPTKI